MTKNPDSELQLAASAEDQPLALSPENPIGRMIEAITKTGVSTDNMAVLERMMDLYERVEVKNAEKQFAEAFVALQSDLPPVQASKPVPNRDGSIRYHFAPYEEIMAQIRPFLQKHGFTVTFSMSFSEGRVVQACTLQHVGGHSRTNQFMARVGNGPPGSSEAQGDGAASTYAKRFALCNALNIVTEIDTDGKDARAAGEPISPDKVQYLREQVRETASDESKFLKLAGVSSFEEITTGSYDVLVRALAAKARAK
jgi:hypothetical protein